MTMISHPLYFKILILVRNKSSHSPKRLLNSRTVSLSLEYHNITQHTNTAKTHKHCKNTQTLQKHTKANKRELTNSFLFIIHHTLHRILEYYFLSTYLKSNLFISFILWKNLKSIAFIPLSCL